MDQLKDLLAQRMPGEPPEVSAIKQYIYEHFQAPSKVTIQNEAIIISVKSAALANTLRLRLPEIQIFAATDRKLLFRIA